MPKVGGSSAASSTPRRPLVPAPTKINRPPPATALTCDDCSDYAPSLPRGGLIFYIMPRGAPLLNPEQALLTGLLHVLGVCRGAPERAQLAQRLAAPPSPFDGARFSTVSVSSVPTSGNTSRLPPIEPYAPMPNPTRCSMTLAGSWTKPISVPISTVSARVGGREVWYASTDVDLFPAPEAFAAMHHEGHKASLKGLGIKFDLFTSTATANHREVVQDVFVTVFRKHASFEGRAALASWIYRITMNAALNKRRGKRHEVETSIDAELPRYTADGHREGDRRFLVADWSESPEAETLSRETRALLAQVWDPLREHPRFRRLLEDESEEMKMAAARALGSVAETGGAQVLQELILSDAPNELRNEAVRALGRTDSGLELILDLAEQERLPAELHAGAERVGADVVDVRAHDAPEPRQNRAQLGFAQMTEEHRVLQAEGAPAQDRRLTAIGGTARTLDGSDGAVPLEPGIISRDGWALVDDSREPVIGGQPPWPRARAAAEARRSRTTPQAPSSAARGPGLLRRP